MAAEKNMMVRLPDRDQKENLNCGTAGSDPAAHNRVVAQFLEWGLAVETGGDILLADGLSADVAGLFAGLIDRHDPVLKPIALTDCPIHFCTGLVRLTVPGNGETGEVGMTVPAGGQGGTPARATVSCLGEMAERLSLFSKGTRDPRVSGKSDEAEDLPLGPVLGFSARQERKLAEINPGVGEVFSKDRIDWNALSERRVQITNLRDGRQAQIPAFGVLMGERETVAGSIPGVASSSGAAVWSSPEEAARRALGELAERDAFGRAWYNRLGITRVCREDWDRILPEKVSRYLSDRTRTAHILRVASDLDVHVLAAVSCQANGFGGCLGVAAAPTATGAAFSAVCEMLQAEISLELSARTYNADRRRGDVPMPQALAVAGTLRLADELGLDHVPRTDTGVLSHAYEVGDLERSCHERNIDLWRFDATDADLGIPCVKILSPHLCSWQPRFGKGRLFAGLKQADAETMRALEENFEWRPFPF